MFPIVDIFRNNLYCNRFKTMSRIHSQGYFFKADFYFLIWRFTFRETYFWGNETWSIMWFVTWSSWISVCQKVPTELLVTFNPLNLTFDFFPQRVRTTSGFEKCSNLHWRKWNKVLKEVTNISKDFFFENFIYSWKYEEYFFLFSPRNLSAANRVSICNCAKFYSKKWSLLFGKTRRIHWNPKVWNFHLFFDRITILWFLATGDGNIERTGWHFNWCFIRLLTWWSSSDRSETKIFFFLLNPQNSFSESFVEYQICKYLIKPLSDRIIFVT